MHSRGGAERRSSRTPAQPSERQLLPLFPGPFAVRPTRDQRRCTRQPARLRDRTTGARLSIRLINQPITPGATPLRRGGRRARPASSLDRRRRSRLSAPDEPTRLPGARTSRVTRDEQTQRAETTGRCLHFPKSRCRRSPVPTQPSAASPLRPAPDADPLRQSTIPADSAPRRGFLSGLFNNLGLNWTRR